MPDTLVKTRAAIQASGVKTTTWYKLLKLGLAPTPVRIQGIRGTFYSYNELQEFIERQKAARNAENEAE